ncbi:MAG: ribonuclease H family protein [Chloroflexota bacterium]
MAKSKVYVVWKGRKTGIFADWEACKAQVSGFPGAQYKAFETRREAERALAGEYADYEGRPASSQKWLFAPNPPIAESIVVDAACSGGTGRLEWRGLRLADGEQVFRRGPYKNGTNNVGEFLAIVHALALLEEGGLSQPVYSDSETAIAWVRLGKCKTDLQPDGQNAALFALIARAEDWLARHPAHNPVLKWDTEAWGEIPADFNRK